MKEEYDTYQVEDTDNNIYAEASDFKLAVDNTLPEK
jgi:hypothetical protein